MPDQADASSACLRNGSETGDDPIMPNIRLRQSRANRFAVQYRDFQGITLKKTRTVIPFPSPQMQYCVKRWIYTTFQWRESIAD